MPITTHDLSAHRFAHTHDIVIVGSKPEFRRLRTAFSGAGIYLWAAPHPARPDEYEAMYVGKAGYGLDRRLSQHSGSFRDNAGGTGRKNRELVEALLASGRTLEVWSRGSEATTLFGQNISLYAAEEAAACAAFEPQWNRANFPSAGVEPNDELPAAIAGAFEAVPQGDEVAAFVQTLDANELVRFRALMILLQARDPDASHKVTKQFEGQPSGYSKKPTLVVGRVRASDGRAVHWIARIPLINESQAPLTVVFPARLLRPGLDDALVSVGSSGAWRPLDLDAFLAAPDTYLRRPEQNS